jgi:[acyl-carrier-protein] S-malonyltransferase
MDMVMSDKIIDGLAMVFPGQGSQSVGMLGDMVDTHPSIKKTFSEASDVLGYDLWQRVQQGPEDLLNQTACTQPAMLTAGVAVWRCWTEQTDCRPSVMAGHSLGEYTALVCANAMSFTDAVDLVEKRGNEMQKAVPEGSGAMAAILGLKDEQVIACCEQAAQGEVVEAVNFNSPGQVVIAGNKTAVERAMVLCKSAGAKRALPIPVSVPSHCELMRTAAERFTDTLNSLDLKLPAIPVIHNADVNVHQTVDAIRSALSQQLYSPVRWVETIQTMSSRGIDTILEMGPGKVLAGLNKRIDKTQTAIAVNNAAGLQKALDAITKTPTTG